MRWLKLLVMAAALGPLCVAARALAAAPSASGVSANGDDLTVCCTAIFVPPAAAPAAEQAPPPLFIPQVVGCTAIGNDASSINGCPGVVMGCSEASFACEPSATSTGKKDCMCSGRLLGVPRL